MAKCMEKYLDITKPRYSEQFLPVPWFCYLRLYFGIDIVSRRLLKWISRIENGLILRPTTRYRTYSNQISTRLIQIMKVTEEGDFEVVYGRTCMTRLGRSVPDHDWCVCIPRLVSY